MFRQLSLPSWATLISKGRVEIRAQEFYPEILKELWDDENWDETCQEQRGSLSQYWLETAYQIAQKDVRHAISGTESMPKRGGALHIMVKDTDKTQYSQKQYPEGKNVAKDIMSRSGEIQKHYNRIRFAI